MSGLFRRFTAFLLGMLFGVVSLVGGVGVGAYWAYKNVKPLSSIEEPIGEIKNSTIEQLAELIVQATQNPDEYTLARIEKEYGLDMAGVLEAVGIDTSTTSNADFEALENVSLLSFLSGMDKFLGSIRVRALYVFIPTITGQSLDDILSREAQATLGDLSVWELINSAEGSEEIGFLSAIKKLKLGSLLPAVFDATYDAQAHKYVYSVKKDLPSQLDVLNLIADVEFGAIIDIASGSDVVTEIVDGDLLTIGKMKIADVFDAIASVTGEEIAEEIAKYTRVFGTLEVRDLFLKNEAGKYEFNADKLVSGIELGYVVGYEKTESGEWVDSDGKKADGLLSVVATLNIGEILSGEGDVVKTIEAVAGDMTIETVFKTFMDEEDIPLVVKKLGQMTVSSIIGSGTDHIVDRLLENLNLGLSDIMLGDALDDILPEKVKDFINSNELLKGFCNLKLGDLIKEKEDYTLDTFVTALENAIGEVRLGDVIGLKNEDGKWECNEFLAILMDKTLGDFLDITRAKNPADIIDDVLGSVTFGDIFGAAFGYTEVDGVYQKDGEKVTTSFDENFLDMKIADLVITIVTGKEQGGVKTNVKALTLGDFYYALAHAIPFMPELAAYDEASGDVFVDNEFKNLSKIVLNLNVNEIYHNYKSWDFWKEKIGVVKVGDIIGYVLNKFTPVKVEISGSDWIVTSDVLKDSIASVLNIDFNDFYSGDWNAIVRKAFGGMTIGDILRNFVPEEYGDNAFIAATYKISVDGILNILDSENEKNDAIYEYIIEVYDDATLGDAVDNFWTSWKDIDALETVLSIKVSDYVAVILGQKSVESVFGDISVKDLTNDVIPEKYKDNNVVVAISSLSVNDIIDLVDGGVTKEKVNNLVEERFGDAIIGDIVEMFYDKWEDVSALKEVCSLKIADVSSMLCGYMPVSEGLASITIGGLLGDVVPESCESNNFVKSAYTINIGEIVEVITEYDNEKLYNKVKEKFNGVILGDVISLFYSDWTSVSALDTIGSITISDYVAVILGQKSVESVFGDISVKDLTDDVIPEKHKDNNVVVAISSLSVNDIIDLVDGGVTKEKVNNLIKTKFDDAIVGDIVEMFYDKWEDVSALKEVCSLKIADVSSMLCGYMPVSEGLVSITIGGLLGDIVPESYESNEFVKVAYTISVGEIVGLVADYSNERLYDKVEEKFDDVVLGSVISLFYPDWALVSPLNAVGSVTIADYTAVLVGKKSVESVFGNITVGELVESFVADKYETNEFVKAVYDVKLSEIMHQTADYIKTKDFTPVYNWICEELDGVVLGSVIELFYTKWNSNSALSTVGNILITDYLDMFVGKESVDSTLGSITFGELLDSFVSEKYKENEFVEAVYAVTVGDVINIVSDFVKSNDGDALYEDIYEMFGDVSTGSIIELFYADYTSISPLKTIGSISVMDYISFALGKKSLEEVFGQITIGDLVESFVPEKISDNKFVANTYEISVKGVVDVLTCKTGRRAALYEYLVEVYDDVILGDVVDNFWTGWEDIDALETIFSINVSDYAGLLLGQRSIESLFGNISVGDLTDNLVAEKYKDNKIVVAISSVTINDIIDLFDDGVTKEKINNLVKERFDDAIVGNLVEIFYDKWEEVSALKEVCSLKVADISDVLCGYMSVSEGLKNITTGGLLGDIIPKGYENNEFVKALYATNAGEIVELVAEYDNEKLYDIIEEKFGEVALGSAITLFYSDWALVSPLNAVGSITISDYAAVLMGKKSVESVFGTITVGELIESFVPDRYETNEFVKAVYSFTISEIINDIYSAVGDKNVDPIYNRIEDKLDNVTLGSVIAIFYDKWASNSVLNVVGSVTIPDYLALALEKKSVDAVFGATTVGDLLGGFISKEAVKEAEVTKALFSVSVNDILDYVLGNVTLSDLVFDKAGEISVNDIQEFVNVVFDKSFDISNDISYGKGAINKILSVKVNDFKDGIKNGVKDIVQSISVGDIAADTVKKIADRLGVAQEYEITDGKYVVTGGFDVLMNDYYNISLYELAKNITNTGWIKGKINKPFGAYLKDITTVVANKMPAFYSGSVAYDGETYSASGSYAALVGKILNITPKEVYDGLKLDGMDYLFGDDLFGKVKLGHLLDGGNNIYEEENDIWYDKDGNAYQFGDGIEGTLKEVMYSLDIGSVVAGDAYSTIFDAVKDIKVGKILGYTNREGNWYDTDADGNETKITGAIAKLASYTVNELTDFNTIIDEWKIGEVIGYIYDETENVWKDEDGNIVTGIIAKVADETLNNLNADTINAWKIGEVMGYTYDETESVWKDKNGNTVTGVIAKLSDETINDLNNFNEVIKDWQIGEVMGYTYNSTENAWYNGSNKITGVLGMVANQTIGGLNSETINGWKIGEIMGYTYDESNGIWKNGETKVTGALAKISGKTLEDLNDLDAIVKTWTLTDVLGSEVVNSSNVLKLVANTQIGDLTTGINNIKVGEVMGYTYDSVSGKWKDAEGTEANGVTLVIADLTIGELNGENMQNKINNMKVGELITIGENNPLNLIKDATIEEAETEMADALKNATIEEMDKYGIIDLNAVVDESDNTTVAEALTYVIGSENWKQMKTADLLTNLVKSAYEAKKTAAALGG